MLGVESSFHCVKSVPNTEFFLVYIFLYSDQKKLRIWTLFAQCSVQLEVSHFLPLLSLHPNVTVGSFWLPNPKFGEGGRGGDESFWEQKLILGYSYATSRVAAMALSGIPLFCPLSLFKNALYALQNSGKSLLSYWERQRQTEIETENIRCICFNVLLFLYCWFNFGCGCSVV